MNTSTLIPKFYNREFNHLGLLGWPTVPKRYGPSSWLSELYHSVNATPGFRNWSDYISPEMDAVLDEQEKEFDTEKRRGLISKAQEIAAKYP